MYKLWFITLIKKVIITDSTENDNSYDPNVLTIKSPKVYQNNRFDATTTSGDKKSIFSVIYFSAKNLGF